MVVVVQGSIEGQFTVSVPSKARGRRISLGQLHFGQKTAHWALQPHRFKALRCGRRFGKTEFAKTWMAQGLVQGEECAWFAPQHMTWSEVYLDLTQMLRPIVDTSSRTPPVIRLSNGGRIDFWSLENPIAGRGRRYRRIVIDEAAFTKDGDNRSDDSMMALWEKGIKPTLFDYGGEALVCSNSAGRNPDNFFYISARTRGTDSMNFMRPRWIIRCCRSAPAMKASTIGALAARGFHEDLRKDNDPLVYAQEYTAEFVDWSGVAFFSREKLLVENRPVPLPAKCDAVFAVIDTASKTGTDNDATAVTFFAFDTIGKISLFVLDWDVAQIEGALLETWLPAVFRSLEELSRLCRARRGSLGAFIEDKNSGTILLQQAWRRQLCVCAIDSRLTAMGKDERAISVSGYVHRELVKYTDRAFEKTVIYKRHSRNHLLDQVESFRVGDQANDREDDLLDTFCYGIALALGNSEGF
jgi:hypothetical protein